MADPIICNDDLVIYDILDDRKDSRLLSYDDLFANWEGSLDFIVKGFDALDPNDLLGGKRGRD